MTNQSTFRLPISVAMALVLAGSVGIAATGPMTWVQSSYDDFRAGEMVSVSLDTNGEICLAPELVLIGDTREAFVWAVAEAAEEVFTDNACIAVMVHQKLMPVKTFGK